MPTPYQGYQPTPALGNYNEPPRFAQFDDSRKGRITEDSLPAMPSWDTASRKQVFEEHKDEEMELGTMDPAKAPMLAHQAPPPRSGYAEMDSSTASLPYQQYGVQHGGDLGNPYGHGPKSPHENNPYSPRLNEAGFVEPQRSYRDDGRVQQSYSAYAPSESTRYEPSSHGGQESGVAYGGRSPAPGPAPAQQSYSINAAPNGLQAGRKPLQDSWRDV